MPILKRSVIFLLFVSFFIQCPLIIQGQEGHGIKISTVVIDPGHGGKDPGTINGRYREKDIVLSVGLILGKMIKDNYPNIKVIYTRNSDKFIPLHQRADIANKNHADLFISIHVNANKSKAASGFETFVMGMDKSNSNFEVCQLENNVVVLEDDYTSRYEGFDPNNPESYIIFSLLQNSHLEQSLIFAEQVQKQMAFGPIKKNRGIKQDVFLVLWKCTMPSTLIELGFLSNPSDIKELINKESHKKMAKSIYDAFINYKNQYENHIDNSTIVTDPIQDNYRIQIMALSKLLDCNSPQFKGLECSVVKSGKLYRYTYGNFATQEEASNELIRIKRLFPEAYVIKTE